MRLLAGFLLIGLLQSGFVTSAVAQELPGTAQAQDALSTAKDAVNTVKNLPNAATDAVVGEIEKHVPAELQPLVNSAGAIAKQLENVANGKMIADAVGSTLDAFGKAISDISNGGKELRERLARLEKENTEKMIEIEHSKANLAQLQAQVEALKQSTAAVMELIEAHKGRIDGLENRVAELERQKGTVTAPFKVVDKTGFTLLLVDEAGATFSSLGGGTTNIQLKQGQPPQLYLGNQAGGLSLEGGETNRTTLVNGDTSVFEMKASSGQGIQMRGTTTEGQFELGSGPALLGLVVRKNDQPAAGLGTFDGRGVALRLFGAGGQVIAAAGENPSVAGTGLVYVGNGSKNSAALAADSDGSGFVHAFAGNGTVGAGLVGKERLVAAYYEGGAAVATLQKSDKSEGGTIRARDPSGEAVFSTGYRADIGGGEACVIRNKRGGNIFCLGLGVPGFGTVR
ncbi:hypothetical protein [Pannonibacter sp.]|uniref:hypothetical protein n=1 Tax=Pannonibacter sp. TaxID=1906786 RepID=UPI003F70B2F9